MLWLKTFEEGFCEAYAHNVLFFESIVLNHSKQYLEALKTLREPDYGEIKHGNPYNFSLLYEQLEDKFNTKHLDSNNLSDEIIPTCVTLSLNNANDVLSKYQNELLSDQSAIKIFTDESSIVLKTQTLNTKIEPFIQPIQKIKENISALRNKNDSLKIGISKKTNNQ